MYDTLQYKDRYAWYSTLGIERNMYWLVEGIALYMERIAHTYVASERALENNCKW